MAKTEASPRQIIESGSYLQSLDRIKNENNRIVEPINNLSSWFAPLRLADPGRVLSVDYSCFKKTEKDLINGPGLKAQWKRDMRKKYGPDWTEKKACKKKYLISYSRGH